MKDKTVESRSKRLNHLKSHMKLHDARFVMVKLTVLRRERGWPKCSVSTNWRIHGSEWAVAAINETWGNGTGYSAITV